ncbi:hypothetical protein [Halosegnis sp.]|uniref:hypothetical protein n=1 Tax=Halosegnis sp. TaxID=2864959 RepID=UPI0035D4F345
MSDDGWEPDPAWDDPTADGPAGWPSLADLDPASIGVGLLVGLAGVLLFIQPSVRAVTLLGRQVPTFVLSAGVLSLGFAVGTPIYLARGHRLRGLAHGIGAVGFGGLFFAAGFGSLTLLWVALALLLGGLLFLVSETRKL